VTSAGHHQRAFELNQGNRGSGKVVLLSCGPSFDVGPTRADRVTRTPLRACHMSGALSRPRRPSRTPPLRHARNERGHKGIPAEVFSAKTQLQGLLAVICSSSSVCYIATVRLSKRGKIEAVGGCRQKDSQLQVARPDGHVSCRQLS
jgi:hypothetical protein